MLYTILIILLILYLLGQLPAVSNSIPNSGSIINILVIVIIVILILQLIGMIR
jgi:hypothetical protein